MPITGLCVSSIQTSFSSLGDGSRKAHRGISHTNTRARARARNSNLRMGDDSLSVLSRSTESIRDHGQQDSPPRVPIGSEAAVGSHRELRRLPLPPTTDIRRQNVWYAPKSGHYFWEIIWFRQRG